MMFIVPLCAHNRFIASSSIAQVWDAAVYGQAPCLSYSRSCGKGPRSDHDWGKVEVACVAVVEGVFVTLQEWIVADYGWQRMPGRRWDHIAAPIVQPGIDSETEINSVNTCFLAAFLTGDRLISIQIPSTAEETLAFKARQPSIFVSTYNCGGCTADGLDLELVLPLWLPLGHDIYILGVRH